jgi:hypothetical protein
VTDDSLSLLLKKLMNLNFLLPFKGIKLVENIEEAKDCKRIESW